MADVAVVYGRRSQERVIVDDNFVRRKLSRNLE